jgi:transposase
MISWEQYMDILALHRQGFSLREISAKLGRHRNTVTKYITQGPPKYKKVNRKESILAPYVQLIDQWLEQDNYRGTWIYNQIKKLGYAGGYDTVKHYVRKVKERNQRKAFIRFETVPGLQGQMDWADFQVVDGASTRTLYLFLFVLGFSRAMYAELVSSCTLEAFMDVHIRAFHYLGGVPLEVLYDNMKHVVIGRSQNKGVIFNIEFEHFCRHYGFKPVPCPPYSPHVKGKVERPVDYVRESFWRGYRFNSIEQANNDLRIWLCKTANRRVHGTHRQVVDIRWQHEIASLKPCPATDYDTSIKVYRKVYKDCMISYDASHYQVPPDVIGKKVLLKIKNGLIRFYDDDRLLATYAVSSEKGSWTTDPAITEQIHRLRILQRQQRYGRLKAKATRGLVNASLYPQVLYRPLSVYEQLAQGGGPWTN